MRILNSALTTLLVASLAGCATGGMGAGESISRLETQQRANPGSATSNRSLGIAYYKEKRYAEARVALETAAKLDPKDGTTALYLGLADEELGDIPAARSAYSSYIQVGRTSRVRTELQNHLTALARKQIQLDAKAAVAQEATLATQPAADPHTVAVMPLQFSGADSTLKPLERGFADLLTTDLARSSQLTLVERSRMQALLDEVKLQQTGATDATTNVRAGKLVRAGSIVQGSLIQLNATDLRADAAVVDVPTSKITGDGTSKTNPIDQVFDLEKQVALGLFTQLGVTLTVAERNAIEQRPTRSLAAFLAYSNGLKAEDEGRYDDASRFFNNAVRIDPGFSAAQQKGAEARSAAAGSNITASSVELSLKGTSEGSAAGGSGSGSSGLGTSAQNTAADLNPSTTGAATGGTTTGGNSSTPHDKDPVTSGTGSDNPSSGGKVTIVIKRPGA